MTEFALPTAGSWPHAIIPVHHGSTWFVEFLNNKVARITDSGEITEFSVPTANSAPHELAAGLDGSIWFVEDDAGQVGRLTVR